MNATISRPLLQEVQLRGLMARKLLQAERICLIDELNNFSRVQDYLSARGANTKGAYTDMLARRDRLTAELGKVPAVTPTAPRPQFNQRPLSAAVAAVSTAIVNQEDLPEFGYSGWVQAGPLVDCDSAIPGGNTSGEIATTALGTLPYVNFNGRLEAPLVDGSNDFRTKYFWLHSWQVLVPFPSPSAVSDLTYEFTVRADFNVFDSGSGTVMSFVTVGESPSLADSLTFADAGWPVNANLAVSTDDYQNYYGSLAGSTTVRRTFTAYPRQLPIVAIIVGAVCGLPMRSSASLSAGGDSVMSITGNDGAGQIAFHYAPHWQPAA